MNVGGTSRGPTMLRGIEGLRGIAAVAVLVHHTVQMVTEDAPNAVATTVADVGNHGLTLFFVLSGFLLYQPFAEALIEGRPLPSWRRFARNRALRIYPAYVVVLLGASYGLQTTYAEGLPGLGYPVGPITDPVVLAANLALVQSYHPSTVMTGLGLSWSLTAEIAFYVALPLLAYAAATLGTLLNRQVAVLAGPAVLIVVGVLTTAALIVAKSGVGDVGRVWFSWGPTWTAVLERSFVAKADLFGYGMMAAVGLVVARRRGGFAVRTKWTLLAACVGCAAMGLQFNIASIGGALVAISVSAGLMLLTDPTPPGSVRRAVLGVLDGSALRRLGLVSYSLYLWHLSALWWLRAHGLVDGRSVAEVAGSVVIVLSFSVALAAVTYRWVEKPAMNWKRKARSLPTTRARGVEATAAGQRGM